MFDEIRSALQDVVGGAEKLRNVLSLPDASTKLSLFLPLQRGAGPMALMLWLDWVT
jgi:hypothetical protein